MLHEVVEAKKPWVRTIRRESGLIEHVCSHHIGHPAYGSVDFASKKSGQKTWCVHGCDGCCNKDEWILADLKEGVEKANDIILMYMDVVKDLRRELEFERKGKQ
jgi:hypothetical protein